MSKSKGIIRVSENFTIRKIIPREIVFKYFKGEYTKRNFPLGKVKTSNALIKVGKDIGKNTTSEVYRFTDRSNNNQIIYTTNHSLYKYMTEYLNNPEKVEMPILKCKYCKRSNLKNPVGIPISMFFTDSSNKNIAFMVSDSFCDFGCSFSYLKRKVGQNRMFRDVHYMNAEQMLYCMYYRIHPGKVGMSIKEKPDWELLRENGGPLTDDEFDSENFDYIPIPSVAVFPVKNQYFKINLKNAREK